MYSKICNRLECQRPFQTKHNGQVFCCRSCAAYVRRDRHSFPAWRKAEVDILERLSGSCPFPEIVERLQGLAQQYDWQPRTTAAIKSYMSLHGYQFKCTLDNFTAAELARILGVKYSRVNNWKRYGKLPYYNVAKTQSVISVKVFKRWAAKYPHYLAEVERDRLLWLLEDGALVDQICQAKVSPLGRPIAIRRVDTGVTYRSLTAAARANHIDQTTLSDMLQQGRRVAGGIPWEIVTS